MINLKRLVLLVLVLLAIGCKSDWRKMEPVMAGIPDDTPKYVKTLKGVTVFYAQRTPTEREKTLIDEGVSSAISRGFRENPNFENPKEYLKWRNYRTHREVQVLLMPTSDFGNRPDTLNCGILNTYSGYAADAVLGFNFRNGELDGNPVVIVPYLYTEEERCRILFRRGVDHGVEHLITANGGMKLAFMFQGEGHYHAIFPVIAGDSY